MNLDDYTPAELREIRKRFTEWRVDADRRCERAAEEISEWRAEWAAQNDRAEWAADVLRAVTEQLHRTDAAFDYKVHERDGYIRPVKLAERVEVSRDSLTHTPTDFRNVELDPLAHVTEGDPDPHPEQSDGDHEMCWESIEATGVLGVDEFTCTRPEGHPGQHIAGDGHEVVKVWNRG